MSSKRVSRRAFARIAGSLAAAGAPLRAAPPPTAQDIVRQIQERLGGEWPATGLDGFKAGKPETEVRGIAATAMATVDVLRQAAKRGLNLIVTHEPTFFGSREGSAPAMPFPGRGGRGPAAAPGDDPVHKAKKDFIESNGMVVFRLRDHWQARKENDMATGLADSLGWSRYLVSGESVLYDIPAATLSDTVALIRKRLTLRGGLRAVGDPNARVRRVMLHPGVMAIDAMLPRFHELDLLLTGEVREWECVPYAADMNSAGEKRALVTIGRVASEDPGMRACAAWLKTVVKGMPVEWISAGDPYWRAA